jgi:hypothetical protein
MCSERRQSEFHRKAKAPAEENSPAENPVPDFSPFLIGLIAFNAFVFGLLYSRRSRRELIGRHLAWVLRADLAVAESDATGTGHLFLFEP